MPIVQKMVFFDRTGRRWAVCRLVLISSVSAALVTAALFTIALFSRPSFPSIKTDLAEVYRQDERNGQVGAPGKIVKTAFTAEVESPGVLPLPQPAPASLSIPDKLPVIFGFHVPWNEESFRSLKANSAHMTHVLAEWIILDGPEGKISDLTEREVVEWACQVHLPVLAMATNFRDGEWRTGEIHQILTHPDARRRLVENLVAVTKRYGLAGINLDLEQVPVGDRNLLTAFVRELHEALNPLGLMLTQDVPTDDPTAPAYDLRALARLDDYVIPMVYDEHFSSGLPGPIASLEWVRQQLHDMLRRLPPEKTVIGLGSYGYDWTLGSARGAVEVSFDDVMSRANQYRGTIEWHRDSMSPSLKYSKAGVKHEVWFLDAVTALNSVREVHKLGFAGVSFWRLGAEDSGVWTIFHERTWPAEDFPTAKLSQLPPIKSVRQYGRGEAIRVTQTRSLGIRGVSHDGTGLSEAFIRTPTGDVVGGLGTSGKKSFTITFDDGPDPSYTPRILDILRAKQVPATFFVVGRLAERSVDLLRRMKSEGHNIGNHTYSHANELRVSDLNLAIELNLTQRVIQYSTGRSTTLFRSPFNADSDPRTPEAIQSVVRPQQLGYLTVGERVDPRDWEGKSANEIVESIMHDRGMGSIILLHDGGGNREATVQALPAIIDALRADGGRFVSLQGLLGRSAESLMPPVNRSEWLWATVEGGLLTLRAKALLVVQVMFLAAIAATLFRNLAYGALALIQRRRFLRRRFDPDFRPPVSVTIAAHNEAKVISNTINTLLASDYTEFEVVVVDDGSTDATLDILHREFRGDRRVRIFSQPNLGKATALNRAISESKHELLVALDADTLFLPNTISKLVRHFSDPQVAAVSGNVKVGNRAKWLSRLQSIEYICGFNLDRRALDVLNAVLVVPGAVGCWRKSAILQAGGYPTDTVAEDADLTLAIRRRGWLIRYDEEAAAYTEVPETLRALHAGQRSRCVQR